MNVAGRFLLRIPARLHAAMLAHALAERPNECCGLFAGRIDNAGEIAEVMHHYALVNELKSPTEYLSEPYSMLAAVKDMRKKGVEVLAVYHSHTASTPVPSRKDLERNYSANVMNLIIGLAGDAPVVRGWWLRDDSFDEARFEVSAD